jgi:hypothetical protein
MASTHSSTGNKLENWIKARFASECDVMNILQEYGVVSDNCLWAKDVGNDGEAMMWIAKNFEHFQKHKVY